MRLIYLSTARIPDDWAHVLQIMKMCEAFASAGAEVTLLAPMRAATRREDPYAFAHVKRNFKIVKLPCVDLFPGTQSGLLYTLRMYSFFFFAWLFLMFARYDVVYTRELRAPTPPGRTVFELHTVVPRMRSLKARALVAITNGIRSDLVAMGHVPEHIIVAPDGVDLAEFAHPEQKEAAQRRLGIPQGGKVALYVGMLGAAWKGIDTLCEAAKLLAPAIQVVVIGGEPHELAKLRPAYPDVLFLGFRPYRELADNLAAADVLVLPNSGKEDISAKHTSPLKLFAYMAAEKPIVASDLPSIREVLSERNSFLVAPDDPAALARGVQGVCADMEGAVARARKARADVERYTWSARAERILKAIV